MAGEKHISADELHSSLYNQYRYQIDSILNNSHFIWGFETVLFGAFGLTFNNFIKPNSCQFVSYVTFVFLIMLGLFASSVWIVLAKASKTWQEWYEDRISSFEQDREIFQFPREYAMGGSTNRLANVDKSLLSLKAGLFSSGKMNIFIAQFVWLIWCILFILVQIFHPYCISNASTTATITVCVVIYVAFVCIMKNRVANKYIRKEDYKGEFIIETYVQIEKSLERLNDTKARKKDLYDYVINDYCSLSWPIYKIYEAQGECSSFDPMWLGESFESLKKDFSNDYIKGNLDSVTCMTYKGKLISEINNQLAMLSEFYRT